MVDINLNDPRLHGYSELWKLPPEEQKAILSRKALFTFKAGENAFETGEVNRSVVSRIVQNRSEENLAGRTFYRGGYATGRLRPGQILSPGSMVAAEEQGVMSATSVRSMALKFLGDPKREYYNIGPTVPTVYEIKPSRFFDIDKTVRGFAPEVDQREVLLQAGRYRVKSVSEVPASTQMLPRNIAGWWRRPDKWRIVNPLVKEAHQIPAHQVVVLEEVMNSHIVGKALSRMKHINRMARLARVFK